MRGMVVDVETGLLPTSSRREVSADAAGQSVQALWTRLRDALRTLFGVIQPACADARGGSSRSGWRRQRDEVLQAGSQDVRPTARAGDGQAVGDSWQELFHVVTTPGVQPTNNLAEQAIRFVVIDRQSRRDAKRGRAALV